MSSYDSSSQNPPWLLGSLQGTANGLQDTEWLGPWVYLQHHCLFLTPLTNSASAMLASLLFPRPTKHTPTQGLGMCCSHPYSRMFFPLTSPWLVPTPVSGLCIQGTFLMKFYFPLSLFKLQLSQFQWATIGFYCTRIIYKVFLSFFCASISIWR